MFIQYGLCFLIVLNLILLFFFIYFFQHIHQVHQQNAKLLELLQKQLDEMDANFSDEDIVPLITDEQLSTLLRATIKRAIELYPQQKQETASSKESSTEPKEKAPPKKDTDGT